MLTPEEDLSPDRSPPKILSLKCMQGEAENSSSLPPSPRPDVVKAEFPTPPVHRAGNDHQPWVKLRQRHLPIYFYRRLPNWFYPECTSPEPYAPSLYNIDQASTREVVAAGGSEAAPSEEPNLDEEGEPSLDENVELNG